MLERTNHHWISVGRYTSYFEFVTRPGLPVGLSSLLRLHFVETGGAIQPIWAALELGVCNLILLFWLYRYGAQRLFEKGGG